MSDSEFQRAGIEIVVSSGTDEEIIKEFRQRMIDGEFDNDGIEIRPFIESDTQHDENCRKAIEAMRKCTNALSMDKKSTEAEKEFLQFCEEVGCLAKFKCR
jgi:hypothetical protein